MEFIGRNSILNLKDLIKQNTLIFTQNNIYNKFKDILISNLKNSNITIFDKIKENPKKEDVDYAKFDLQEKQFDCIIAFGGGSVIDFAKAYRYYSNQDIPLIAIPTTAGTGSQATQFAVVYVDGQKTSIDNPVILPNHSIVDSQFFENAPLYLKACSAIDAFCQAIESYWAKKATLESKKYALKSICLCRDYIVEAVKTNNPIANEQMAKAAHYSGKAINISRTTAAHALSYKITSKYGIPHGHAVALSMIGLFNLNVNTSENFKPLYDALGISENSFDNYFYSLTKQIGLELNLKKIGIDDIEDIIDSVNIERLNNNPIILSRKDLLNIFMF